ncbi:MAG: hypothetical protein PHG98_02950 [Bacteroidales bacterium]|nr:hypothetical protein [Bacteroidales bacterium]MDD4738888.1 hypothetical protein [Bacteroidales bacterium]
MYRKFILIILLSFIYSINNKSYSQHETITLGPSDCVGLKYKVLNSKPCCAFAYIDTDANTYYKLIRVEISSILFKHFDGDFITDKEILDCNYLIFPLNYELKTDTTLLGSFNFSVNAKCFEFTQDLKPFTTFKISERYDVRLSSFCCDIDDYRFDKSDERDYIRCKKILDMINSCIEECDKRGRIIID